MQGARANLDGVRVLVVDDHADTVEMLTQVLPYCGASVADARSAREAVPLLADADVVVTDLNMPEHDGIWLLEQVRLIPRRVPVLALTGVSTMHSARLAEAGFDRVLLKPVDPLDLCDEIETMLRPRA